MTISAESRSSSFWLIICSQLHCCGTGNSEIRVSSLLILSSLCSDNCLVKPSIWVLSSEIVSLQSQFWCSDSYFYKSIICAPQSHTWDRSYNWDFSSLIWSSQLHFWCNESLIHFSTKPIWFLKISYWLTHNSLI